MGERLCAQGCVGGAPRPIQRCLPKAKAEGAGQLSIQRVGPAPMSGKVVRTADGRGTETLQLSLSKSTSRLPGFCEACFLSGVSRPHSLVPVGAAPHNLQTHGHWSEDTPLQLLNVVLKVGAEDEEVSSPWEDASLHGGTCTA